MYAIIDGHTGGRTDAAQAAATNTLLKIVREERDAQPEGPKTVAGDLNTDTKHRPALQQMTEKEHWTGIRHNATICRGTPDEFT